MWITSYKYKNVDLTQFYHFIFQAIFPLYDLKTHFNSKKFLEVLSTEIENLKIYPHWDSNEKKTLDNIVSKFDATCNPKRSNYLFTYYML